MHILNALTALCDIADRANAEMVGPAMTNKAMNDFAWQYRLLLAAIQTGRNKKKMSDTHPVIDQVDRWVDLRVKPLLSGGDSLREWNEASVAMRWISVNGAAIYDLLTTWGKLTEDKNDDTSRYYLREPKADDAPKYGGGKLPALWDSSVLAYAADRIPMPKWKEEDHRPLFLTKMNKTSHRAKIAVDGVGHMRGFIVREINHPDMRLEHIGSVSSISARYTEMLGIARCVLEAANDPMDPLADPLLIRLKMARPSA